MHRSKNTTLMHVPGGLSVMVALCDGCCVHAYIVASYTLGIHVCYGQSMDLCNPWVVLHKVVINTFAQQTMDLLPNCNPWIVCSVPCAKYGLSRRNFVLF